MLATQTQLWLLALEITRSNISHNSQEVFCL